MSSLDLTALRVIAAKDIDQAASSGAKEIVTRKGAVITPLAADAVHATRDHHPAGGRRGSGVFDGEGCHGRAAGSTRIACGVAASPGALQFAGGGADQGRDRRDGQEALAPSVRRRQRGQHLVPPRPERSAVHADAVQQVRPHPRAHLHGRSRGQPTGGIGGANERDLPAPPDLQGRSRGEGRGALPSAARDRVRHYGPRASLGHRAPSSTCSSAPSRWRHTRRPAPSVSRRRCCRS